MAKVEDAVGITIPERAGLDPRVVAVPVVVLDQRVEPQDVRHSVKVVYPVGRQIHAGTGEGCDREKWLRELYGKVRPRLDGGKPAVLPHRIDLLHGSRIHHDQDGLH